METPTCNHITVKCNLLDKDKVQTFLSKCTIENGYVGDCIMEASYIFSCHSIKRQKYCDGTSGISIDYINSESN